MTYKFLVVCLTVSAITYSSALAVEGSIGDDSTGVTFDQAEYESGVVTLAHAIEIHTVGHSPASVTCVSANAGCCSSPNGLSASICSQGGVACGHTAHGGRCGVLGHGSGARGHHCLRGERCFAHGSICCRCGCGLLGCRCLPSTIHPPGNMLPHLPYEAQPKTYYYFRPYNYFHIEQHQSVAENWGAPRHAPYSNAMFAEVYEQFEVEDEPVEEVPPLEPKLPEPLSPSDEQP